MTESILRPAHRAWWQRLLVYSLFVFSTFTIAGTEASIILLLVLALWQAAREGREPWSGLPGWFVAAFLALPVVAVVSALVNPDPLTTLDHLRRHYRLLLPFALVPALVFVSLRKLLLAYGACIVLIGIYGLIQYRYGVDWFRPEGQKLITPYGASGVFNAKGNFTHHLTYAGFLLINVPVFAALAVADPGRWRVAWGTVAACAVLGTLVSLGRSGWLGMGVGLLVLAAVMLPRRWGATILIAGVAGIVAVGYLLSHEGLKAQLLRKNSPVIVKRLLRTGFAHDVDRLRIWESGWLAVQAKPILGHGWGNQSPALDPYRQQVSEKHGGYRFMLKSSAGLHNIYLQMFFAVGIVGLAAYLVLWGAVFLWCYTSAARAGPDRPFERALLLGILAGSAGSLAAGWFENNFLDGEVQTLLMMLIGIALFVGIRLRASGAVPAGGRKAAS